MNDELMDSFESLTPPSSYLRLKNNHSNQWNVKLLYFIDFFQNSKFSTEIWKKWLL